MKKIIFFYGFLILALIGCKNSADNKAEFKPISGKQKWLNTKDKDIAELISKIDSLNPVLEVLENKSSDNVNLEPVNPKKWFEIFKPDSLIFWRDTDSLFKIFKQYNNIRGNAYVVSIEKTVDTVEYVMIYGVTIKTDTIGGLIIKKGTYVMSKFTPIKQFNEGKYSMIRFNRYEPFLKYLFSELEPIKKQMDSPSDNQPMITLKY